MKRRFSFKALIAALAIILTLACAANALPPVQLGPGGLGTWTYIDETWIVNSNPFQLNAYANATKVDGGNGDYAWEIIPDPTQTAYLVAAALPKTADATDVFDIRLNSQDQVEAVAPFSHDAATIPEPKTMLLVGCGLLGIAGFGRKKFFKKP